MWVMTSAPPGACRIVEAKPGSDDGAVGEDVPAGVDETGPAGGGQGYPVDEGVRTHDHDGTTLWWMRPDRCTRLRQPRGGGNQPQGRQPRRRMTTNRNPPRDPADLPRQASSGCESKRPRPSGNGTWTCTTSPRWATSLSRGMESYSRRTWPGLACWGWIGPLWQSDQKSGK